MSAAVRLGGVVATAAVLLLVAPRSGLVGPLALRAQTPAPAQPPSERPQFRSTVDVFQLDVSVVDKARQPVRGLTRDDFTVLEDGKPQPIVSFSEVAFPERDGPIYESQELVAPDVQSNRFNDRRLFCLVIDDFGMPYSPGSGYAGQAIAVPEVKRVGREFVASLGPMDLAAVVFTKAGNYVPDFTNRYSKLTGAIENFSPPGEAERATLELQTRGRVGLMPALEDIVTYMAKLPQHRKTIVYIGAGNPRSVAIVTHEADTWDAVNGHAREITRRAAREGIAISSIDINADLQSQVGPLPAGADFLRMLADDTGGFFGVGWHGSEASIAQVFRETQSYYLIGYQREVAYDGKERSIDVRVRQRGLEVHARRGYVNPRADDTYVKAPAPAQDDALEAAMKTLDEADAPRRLFARAAADGAGFTVTAEIGAEESAEPAWREGADVEVRVTRAGRDAVAAASGRITPGARSIALHVPVAAAAAADPALQVTVIVRHGGESLEEHAGLVRTGARLGVAEIFRAPMSPRAPFAPVADPVFSRMERIRVRWPLLAPADERRIRVLRKSGDPLPFAPPLAVDDADGRPVLTTEMPLGALGAGEYAIELVAGTGGDAERALVPFRIAQ
jgi:VWFA-related protein